MAQAPATSWSCTRFSDRGGTYFVSVAQHAGLADGDVDLAVTDGGAAWTATGVRGDSLRGPAGLGAPDKLRHLLAALSDLQPAAVEYGRKAKRQEDGGMELTVEWQPPNQAAGLRLQVRVSLSPAPAAAPIVADTLGLLLDNLSATGLVAAEQQRAAGEWEAQASRSDQLVRQYVQERAAQDKEANARVAALLNSKKKKLRELQAQLQEAQEELERLRGGGAGAMDVDGGGGGKAEASGGIKMERDDDADAAGPSYQQQEQEQAAAGGEESSSFDDDDDDRSEDRYTRESTPDRSD